MGKLIGLAVAVIVFLVFIVQNRTDVKFTFLFFHFTWPAWGMLVLLFVIGVLTGLITSAVLRRRRRERRRG